MAIKVLAVGHENVKEFAEELFPGSVVESASLRPRKMHKDFDALVSYMVLPRVPFGKVESVARSWVDAVKQGGEVVIFVPSLEWAAYQILTPDRSPALIMHLFGSQVEPTEFYNSGFTMMDMRSLCSKLGLAVTHAQTGEYTIGEYDCECHVVRGVKK